MGARALLIGVLPVGDERTGTRETWELTAQAGAGAGRVTADAVFVIADTACALVVRGTASTEVLLWLASVTVTPVTGLTVRVVVAGVLAGA